MVWAHLSWRFGLAEALPEVGPEVLVHGSKMSKVPVVWITFGIFFRAIQMISCRNCWPWTKPGYITMTRRQSNNEWIGSIAAHPAPKNSEIKNPLQKFSPWFFRIKAASALLIISKGPNYQRGVSLISAGETEGLLKGKSRRKFTKVVLFLHNNASAHRALVT